MNEYKFVFDYGENAYVLAKSRSEAISKYCAACGMSADWLKCHCKITNMGKVTWGRKPHE